MDQCGEGGANDSCNRSPSSRFPSDGTLKVYPTWKIRAMEQRKLLGGCLDELLSGKSDVFFVLRFAEAELNSCLLL